MHSLQGRNTSSILFLGTWSDSWETEGKGPFGAFINSCTIPNSFGDSHYISETIYTNFTFDATALFPSLGVSHCISPVVPDKKFQFGAKMTTQSTHFLPSVPNSRLRAMESQYNPLMPETPSSTSIHQVLNVL